MTRDYGFQGLRVRVAVEDPGVATALDRRLRGCPPSAADAPLAHLHYAVGRGRPAPDDDPAWRSVYDTPDGSLEHRAESDELRACLSGVRLDADLRARTATITAPGLDDRARYLAAHPLTTLTLNELAKRQGRFAVHAGCVAHEDRGVLIAGTSGAGKSTLTLTLALAGMAYVSDDMVYLDGQDVVGFADAAGVMPDAGARFPELQLAVADEPPAGFRKHLIRVEERFAIEVVDRCRPVAVVFPELRDEEATLTPMDPAEAWMRLLPDVLLTDEQSTRAHVAAVAALTERIPAHRLVCGPDLTRPTGLVRSLL